MPCFMTVQPPAAAFRSNARTEFCRLRSDFVDAFVRLEMAVGRCLTRLDIAFDAKKCSFDQRIEKLSKAKPGTKLSRANAARLATLPHECEPFQRLRASMVHGVMTIAMTDDGEVAIFRNAADVIEDSQVCYALSAPDLRQQIAGLDALKATIESLTQPSPHPPKPAAKAGP